MKKIKNKVLADFLFYTKDTLFTFFFYYAVFFLFFY